MDEDQILSAAEQPDLADLGEHEAWLPSVSAREILRQGMSITGRVHHLHHDIGYESKLEWLCVQCLLMDPFTRLLIEQPAKVEEGDIVAFPDYLHVRYGGLSSVLIEVKPLDILVRDWEKFEPKFRATERFAQSKRCEFRVVTSRCLERPRARNARFLLGYQLFAEAVDKSLVIRETVSESPGITVISLIEKVCGSIADRPAWTSELYRLMANREIWYDEEKLLDPDSAVFPQRPYSPEVIGYALSTLPGLIAEVHEQEAMKARKDAEQREKLRSTDVIFLTRGAKCNLDGNLVVFELISSPGRAIVRREGVAVACDLANLQPLQHSLEEMRKAQANLDPEFLTYSEQQQAEGIRLRAGLEHLAIRKNVPRAEVKEAARAVGIGATTAYKYLRKFRIRPVTSSFIPERKQRSDAGTTKEPQIYPFFEEAFRAKYTSGQRGSVLAVWRRLEELLLGIGHTPSKETIRRWCEKMDGRISIKTRSRTETETQILDHLHGTFKTDYPLAVVQLDTTWMDLHKVATHDRSQKVGRCYLTVAIDVYSRIVLGFFLSFNPPSGYNVGQCIRNVILPKNGWLAARGMTDVSMPVFGIPGALHTDGGSENDNELIRSIGREWNITTVIRPAKRVRYGAHIERLLGTVATKLKERLGAAFGSSEERGDYESELKAVYTLQEAEQDLIRIFWAEYHNERHSTLGMTPLEKLAEGMIVRPGKLGGGCLRVCGNPEKLKRDVLPFKMVTVQGYGIQWDYFRYYSPTIDYWRFNPHPDGGHEFLARRDNIFVNKLCFWDPKINDYIDVSLVRDTAPMDLTELRECTEFVHSMGWVPDTDKIIQSRKLRQQIEDTAKAKTLKARRATERKVQSAISRELENSMKDRNSPSFTGDGAATTVPTESITIDPSTVDLSGIEDL